MSKKTTAALVHGFWNSGYKSKKKSLVWASRTPHGNNSNELDSDRELYISELAQEEDEFQEQVTWFEEKVPLKLPDYLSTDESIQIRKFLEDNDAAFATDFDQLGRCVVQSHCIRTDTDVPIYQFLYTKSLAE